MEDLIQRFPHIAEQILEQLDNKSLANCKTVSDSWQNFIEDRNFTWIRITKLPSVLNHGNTYLHLAAKTGHITVIAYLIENTTKLTRI